MQCFSCLIYLNYLFIYYYYLLFVGDDDAEDVRLVVQAPLDVNSESYINIKRNDPTLAEIKAMVTFLKKYFTSSTDNDDDRARSRVFVDHLIQGAIFVVDLTIPSRCIIPGDRADLEYLDDLRKQISFDMRSQDHILQVKGRPNQIMYNYGASCIIPFGALSL